MKVFSVIVVAALGVLALGLNLAEAGPPPLPLNVSGPQWQPLSQRQDQGLQAGLELALKQHASWQPLLVQGKMSVGLVDLSNPKAPRVAQVNGGTMMYGASLPKLMILLAAFQGFEDGTLKDTPEVHRDLIEMIRRSDNLAASRMIGRIGLRKSRRWPVIVVISSTTPKRAGASGWGAPTPLAAKRIPNPLRVCPTRPRPISSAVSITSWLTAGSSARSARAKC